MSAFRIKVAGVTYVGIFASNAAAAEDAERRFPTAWPAQVLRHGGARA
ncbi:hypothetical protein [Xylophilus rhododendri]|nr:hypothetical protein [Xylophilus rhododendri]